MDKVELRYFHHNHKDKPISYTVFLDTFPYCQARGRFLPQQSLPLTRRSPFPSLSAFSCVLLSRYPFACLATLRVDFFKVLRIQQLNVRYEQFSTLTCSVCVAEVTRGYRISPTPLVMLRIF